MGKFGFRKRFRLYRDGLFMPLELGGAENKHAWVKDLDGNRIEPMQMATDSKPALAVAALKGMKDEGAAHDGGNFSRGTRQVLVSFRDTAHQSLTPNEGYR